MIIKQIMLRHSESEGFTLPGIIEDPACTTGIVISDKPATGPDAINLISFDILINSNAMFLKIEEHIAISNLLCKEKK
jgi:hypothetical protein